MTKDVIGSTNLNQKNISKKDILDKSKTYQVIFGLVLMMFSRIVVALGINSLINFIHYFYFIILFLLYFLVDFLNHKVKSVQKFVAFLLILFAFSSAINSVGFLNIILSFLLVSQPFILISLMSDGIDFKIIEKFIVSIFVINALFAYFQYIVLGCRIDNVKGIFLNMGAGHHICGAVAIMAMIYYFYRYRNNSTKILINKKTIIKWCRIILQFIVVFLCDNKQSLFVFLATICVFVLVSRMSFMQKACCFIAIAFLCGIIYVMGMTVFPAIQHYLNFEKDLYGVKSKFYIFKYFFEEGNLFNYLFGYGAGMTVSRTAQILPEYFWLSKFGATISEMQVEIMDIQQSNWITNTYTGSSMFSLYFSYSGFLGDYGLVGIIAIFCGYYRFIIKKCKTTPSKLIAIYLFLHGIVFQWLEEPQFVTVAVIFILVELNKYRLSLSRSAKN